MAAYPNYSGDYAYIPGVENLTLTKVANGATLSGVGRKGSITVQDIQGGQAVGVSPKDCSFILWLGTFGDYTPVNGDRLTRSSPAETWTIVVIGTRSDDEQCRVVCKKGPVNT